MIKYWKYFAALALGVLLAACAKQTTLSTGEKSREQLALWVEHYYPGLKPDASGLYILEDTPGTGKVWGTDSAYTYAYASTTIAGLNGVISSTTEEEIAKQLGTYVKGNYYGPRFQKIGEGSSYAGLDALFSGMRVGGVRKAIIPAWMLTTTRKDSQQAYLDASSSESHAVYTVRLVNQFDDIDKAEADSLLRYVRRVYGSQLQSVSYTDEAPDGSFYFVSDSSAFVGTEKLPADTTLTINYTGRLLNGQVFDTTDEKTAKDAGIYSASKTYEPVSVTLKEDYSSITMGSSSLISGFQGGLHLMHWAGQKAVVLFTSAHGYMYSGSGNTIPPYSPLIFELELVKE